MRKIYLYVISTFLILTGVGGWIASTTQARVEVPTRAETMNSSQVTVNARDLPSEHFTDYTFVFN